MSRAANDAHLIQLVRGAFGRDEALQEGSRLDVSSCRMMVSLHGSVKSDGRRERAERVAASVSGVEGVINKLRVNPETTSSPPRTGR
ncbi:BON domain-containing protein [Rubrobacter indicoceani]|uniref:BON domain-containing protein n=1 Tax=Rubrobacter indicoceani TaxID=2051957 RepID=UPI000E5A9437|nr:BON domain-containing protein [Rubrobacter indicoceani]